MGGGRTLGTKGGGVTVGGVREGSFGLAYGHVIGPRVANKILEACVGKIVFSLFRLSDSYYHFDPSLVTCFGFSSG